MKVIDLLNKIANEEDIPSPIYHNNIYYDFEDGDYFNKTTRNWLFNDSDINTILNDEVKTTKEDKKIEKIDIRNEKNCKNNWKWKVYGEEHNYNISTPQKIIADKINEIIDYLEEKNNEN